MVNQLAGIRRVKALTCTSEIESQSVFDAFVVLLRNTTWKCGKVERLIVNYLRRQLQRCGYTQSSIKDMLEHFRLNEKQELRFLKAMERLERRCIIKIVFSPFTSADSLNALSKQGEL